MNIQSPGSTPKKNTIKLARKHLKKSPIQYKKRRKSSIPLKFREFISSNSLNKIMPKFSGKHHYTGEISSKDNKKLNIINTNIPEVSENSSNIKETIKIKNDKNSKKKENNNYFIHYIKNVYENESHLNKENIIKSAKKNIHDSFLKFIETNKNNRVPLAKRRNSALNEYFMKSNFHKINLGFDKDQINEKVPRSIIDKKQSAEIGKLLHKKKLDSKDKKHNNKSKHKHKNKDKDLEKDNKTAKKISNKIIKTSDITTHKKKIKDKEKDTLPNDDENENKANTEINTESTKTKKKSKIRKFLCCIINDNCDSSIENK